ncbi:primosomal protein N' [Curtobacterium sp. MCBD17_028]|uniref:primosomal protein N' family DNA-binding protein n=1 Tax=Curtobacterium sp. MCBD17_028 TaxID=2175670 RepID=UPI0021ABB03A|nr:primosomal protein N' [Curtobacterium sp. MCBD17_028]
MPTVEAAASPVPAGTASPASATPRIARVVLDSPLPQLDRLFDYRIPDAMREACLPGVRVRVPLRTGARIADAFVVEVATEGSFPGDLSPLEEVVSPVPVLAPEVWRLARAVADRAAGVASDVLRLAVPPRQVRAEKAFLARDTTTVPPVVTAPVVTAYPEGRVEALLEDGGRAAMTAIAHPVRLPGDSWVDGWARTFAEAAARVLASERTAILVVPDFRDLAEVERAVAAFVPAERVVRFDARQTNGQRARALLTARSGPVVVVGNRAAVYAPAERLGLLAVWDDGDPSFVEQRAPYVHTRDAVLLRTAQSGAALLLAAHARSTDVQRLVELGWLDDVRPVRAVVPRVVPTAQQTSAEGWAAHARIPSAAWRAAREASRTGPVLVQVASPGFATGLVCADCGDRARCPRCGGPLGRATSSGVPQCRWCGALAVGYRCPTCQGSTLRPVGHGAQRTADELGRAFPGTRIVVADGARPVDEVDDRPAVVVATRGAEPSTPGGYACVLLLDGERMLAREGLRVAEDVLRVWANAAARTARGGTTFLVGVGGRLATAMATWRLEVPAHDELADRRVLHFPPAVRVATLTGTDEAVAAAVEALGDALVGPVLGPVAVDDPVPGTVRTIVRFPYAHGTEVAATLKAEVIRRSSTRRVLPGGNRRRAAPTLRVRLDDVEPFSEGP